MYSVLDLADVAFLSRTTSWSPVALGSALSLWLDAADSSTITLNGSTVSQWRDKSSNAIPFSQPTSSKQPSYGTSGLAKNTLNFDGVDDVLDGDDVLDTVWTGSAFQIFFVAKNNDVATTNGTILAKTSGSPQNLRQFASYLRANRSQLVTLYTPDTGNYTVVNGSTVIVNSQWVFSSHAYTDTGTGSADTTERVEIVVDGAEQTEVVSAFSGSLGTIQNTDCHLSIGASVGDGTQSGSLLDGSVGEILVTSSVVSLDDRQKLEGYLAWKWGGTTRLWTPADLDSSLALWLDADDASTITLNGSAVSQWKDKRNNGINLSQSTAANQPSYNTRTLNGKNVIEFSGDQMLFSASSIASGNPNVLIAVVVQYDTNSTSTDDRSVQLSSGAGTSYAISGGVQGYSSRFNNGNEVYAATSLATPLMQIGTRASGSNYAASQMFIDGTESARTSGSSDTSVPNIGIGVSVGAGAISSNALGTIGSPMDGYIAETVILSDVTLATRQKLEGYLAHKWGLAANLPADHPYKNAAPEVTI